MNRPVWSPTEGVESTSLQEERIALSNEWHARPNISLPSPCRCSHVVTMRQQQTQVECRERFGDFCQQQGKSPPARDSRHHVVEVGPCLIKWESHTEATAHTVLLAGNGNPLFGETALDFLPEAKRRELTEDMFVGVHVEVVRDPPENDPHGVNLARSLLGSQALYGGGMANDAAVVWSTFRADSRGFIRLLIIDIALDRERLARLLQRLLDIETYRMLAMKALPEARHVMGALEALEPDLAGITHRLALKHDPPTQERALEEISGIAARVEQLASAHAYRFAGARAYREIVERRSDELSETELESYQRYTKFLLKSLLPAMRTCDAAERRTHELAERVSRASNLLSTMVGMEQSRRGQAVLRALAERSSMQLRLQQAVEGFSIFAITYYAVGLLNYALKAASAAGLGIDSQLWTGIASPLVLGVVFVSVHSVRKRLTAKLQARGEEPE